MERPEFDRLCAAVAEGREEYVENSHLRYTGRVTECRRDLVLGEAFGHPFTWKREECRSIDSPVEPLGPPSRDL